MTTQIVITTLLVVGQIFSFGNFLNRTIKLEDNLWIEWVIIGALMIFEYLIWK